MIALACKIKIIEKYSRRMNSYLQRVFDHNHKIAKFGVRLLHKASSYEEKKEDISIHQIRNVGVMAHVDAGKTTTTERMLYYSGFTKHIGNVNDGNTVTDYMVQERERGITITSAAVTFFWNQHRINLIDTPGHVDFTAEVECSLQALDGALTLLDASAGVEAQIQTVWRQAAKYNIPQIIFINKMDKVGADFFSSVESIKEKLGGIPLPLQLPIWKDKDFIGIIDLLDMSKYIWDKTDDDGKRFSCERLDQTRDKNIYDEALCYRMHLLELLANFDERIGDHFLHDSDFTHLQKSDLILAIRRVTKSGNAVPVLCGSSLRNRAIQQLLDAIILFLPDPTEHKFVNSCSNRMCSLAFKIVHNKQHVPLTFLRIYSGNLSLGASLYNVNRNCNEKVEKLYQVNANEYKEIHEVKMGNIAAVKGLKMV